MLKALVLVAALSLSGNAQNGNSKSASFSESAIRKCSLMHSTKPIFNICLKGEASAADLERGKTWATRSTLSWFRVLKTLDRNVTREVVFTCQSPHLTIHLRKGGGTSFANPSVTTIYLSRPYGTWTHELGHALAGLSDTYAGAAGQCGNQPQSLMCWGAYGPRANPDQWSTLWPDDIEGIRKNYRKVANEMLFPPDWAPWIDPEKALDPSNPWPDFQFQSYSDVDTEVTVTSGSETEIDYSPDTDSLDL